MKFRNTLPLRRITLILLTTFYTLATISNAEEITGRAPDNTIGAAIGGWSGFLIGGAGGGPLGAVLVGLGGTWLGGEVQEATKLSDTAYIVQSEDGQQTKVRSPNRTWETGDQVAVRGNRLHALNP